MWVWDKSEILFRLRKRDQNVPRLHIWGCIGHGFKSELVIFPQHTVQQKDSTTKDPDWKPNKSKKEPFRVNGEAYLKYCIRPLNRNANFKHKIFMQDGATIHRAAETTIRRFGWSFIEDWPPYSPDLNPIEQIWAYLNAEVAKFRPKTREELEYFTRKVWNDIPQSKIDNFADSFGSKLAECYENKGKPVN
jgi:transposase